MIRRHILLVEDDVQMVQTVKFILNHAGYVVKTAGNGYDALTIAQAFRFDVILLDLNMPLVNGFEFLERFRATDAGKNVPVFVMTVRDDKNTILRAKKLGVEHYFIKPIVKDDLLKRIEAVLGTRPVGYTYKIPMDSPQGEVTMQFAARIVSVSDTGLMFQSPVALEMDYMLSNWVNPVFQKLGISSPKLHVCDCKKNGKMFEVYVSFIDMPEKDLQLIREWVLESTLKARNLAAS